MVIERASSNSSFIDVLDRVLDKGIVIDAWLRVSLVGIDLVTVEARVVVASIATYFSHADAIAQLPRASSAGRVLRPAQELTRSDQRCGGQMPSFAAHQH